MTTEKYIKRVRRKLNLPNEIKERVISDFRSSITARRENGLSDDEIIRELGTPKEVAADFNTQMQEYAYKKSPWRWACLALAVVGAGAVGYHAAVNYLTDTLNRILGRIVNAGDVGYVGIIGGADGPTSIFVTAPDGSGTKQIITCLLLIAMGIVGFLALRKCPSVKKGNSESPSK